MYAVKGAFVTGDLFSEPLAISVELTESLIDELKEAKKIIDSVNSTEKYAHEHISVTVTIFDIDYTLHEVDQSTEDDPIGFCVCESVDLAPSTDAEYYRFDVHAHVDRTEELSITLSVRYGAETISTSMPIDKMIKAYQ